MADEEFNYQEWHKKDMEEFWERVRRQVERDKASGLIAADEPPTFLRKHLVTKQYRLASIMVALLLIVSTIAGWASYSTIWALFFAGLGLTSLFACLIVPLYDQGERELSGNKAKRVGVELIYLVLATFGGTALFILLAGNSFAMIIELAVMIAIFVDWGRNFYELLSYGLPED